MVIRIWGNVLDLNRDALTFAGKLEIGGRRREAGGWRLETGGWSQKKCFYK
ncbi:hypothetical protein QUB37_20085 [Microcoleus sp. AT3-A2]|uniref:hypothetical protein n=1 Tax=Microcoleus sp. AT3-A2 TaxID=2818610 RepID=UPI002FD16942